MTFEKRIIAAIVSIGQLDDVDATNIETKKCTHYYRVTLSYYSCEKENAKFVTNVYCKQCNTS